MGLRIFAGPQAYVFSLLLLLVLLCGGYVAWWYFLAGRVEASLPDIVAGMEEDGIIFDPGTYQVSGFPYRIEIDFDAPRVAGADWAWLPERVQVYFQPWNLRHAVILAPGRHQIATGRVSHEWILRGLRASAILDGLGGLRRVAIEAEGLSSQDPGFSFAVSNAQVHARWQEEELDLAMLLEGAFYGEGDAQRLIFNDFSFKGRAVPPEGFVDLQIWADRGGLVQVDSLLFKRADFEGEAEGAVTLDSVGRPLGTFTLTMSGYEQTLQELAETGKIPPLAVLALGLALETLEEAGEGGVPVTMQNGRLGVAGIPLLSLPAVLDPAGMQ